MSRVLPLLLVALVLGCRPSLPAPVTPLSQTSRHSLPANAPAVAFEPAAAPPVTAHVLTNGLRIFVIRRQGVRGVSIHYALRAAAEDGSLGRAGSARFGLDLATDPVALRAAFGEGPPSLAAYADRAGGHVVVSTELDRLESSLAGLALLARTTGFDAERVRRVAQAYFDALDDSDSDNRGLSLRHAARILYGEQSPFGQSPFELFRTVTDFSLSRLEHQHRQMFAPASSALIICGDAPDDTVLRQVETHFGSLAPVAVVAPRRAHSTGPSTARRARVLLLSGRYARIMHAFPAPPARSSERVAFELLSFVAAESSVSRISKHLREQAGQAYQVHGSYEPRADRGTWLAETVVDRGEVKPALAIIAAELARLRSESVPDMELSRARTQLRERRRAQLADVEGATHLAATEFLLAPPDATPDLQASWNQYYAEIDRVSASGLLQLAQRRLVDSARAVVIAGDVEDYVLDLGIPFRDVDVYTRRALQLAGDTVDEQDASP